MASTPLFAGLIIDENNNAVEIGYVGSEPCYIVDDAGFKRHIPSEDVDRQILQQMVDQVKGHEDLFVDQASKMLGQDDIFSKAILQNQIKNIDQQLKTILQTGIPEEGKAYMGMMGFKIIINIHGEIVEIVQPGRIADPDEE